MNKDLWIFNGANSRFASAVFDTLELAENWIKSNNLTGILTNYPINESVYDWAIKNKFFLPTKIEHSNSEFIAKFTSASQKHFHYENGVRE